MKIIFSKTTTTGVQIFGKLFLEKKDITRVGFVFDSCFKHNYPSFFRVGQIAVFTPKQKKI
jgi:hypothetical protein